MSEGYSEKSIFPQILVYVDKNPQIIIYIPSQNCLNKSLYVIHALMSQFACLMLLFSSANFHQNQLFQKIFQGHYERVKCF